MRSFRLALAAALAVTFASSPASAQAPASGFAVDRLYTSAAGAGWIVMDTLDMHGGLGGAARTSIAYARNPLKVGDTAVIADQVAANFGFAVTYDRLRLSLDFNMPLATKGSDATSGGYDFTAPSITVGSEPDTLSDTRIGFDARLFGEPDSALRLGLSTQLFITSGDRNDYLTDGTYRGMSRFLFAGDLGRFSYAGHVGLHFRTRDEKAPENPRGMELLVGAAAGVNVRSGTAMRLVLGPEIFGATAMRSAFGAQTTALEGLLSARLETHDEGLQWRAKLGVGPGLNAHFGAPDFRLFAGVELFGLAKDR
jgi:hypothetical protein